MIIGFFDRVEMTIQNLPNKTKLKKCYNPCVLNFFYNAFDCLVRAVRKIAGKYRFANITKKN